MIVLVLAQRVQCVESTYVAFATTTHAIAQPVLLTNNFSIKFLLGPTFLIDDMVAPGFKMREPFAQPTGLSAIITVCCIGDVVCLEGKFLA